MAKIEVQEFIRKRQNQVIMGTFAVVSIITFICWLTFNKSDSDLKVTLCSITRADLTAMVSSAGTIGSEADKQFTASTAGYYKPMPNAVLGAEIKKGQTLGQVLNDKLIQDLEAAKIDHNFTLVEYKNLLKENELNKKLFSQKAISQKDLDASNLAVEKYKLQTIITSRKKLDDALKTVADTHLLAPFDGTLVDAPLKPDSAVNANDKLLRLADLHTLKALLLVSEYDFRMLAIGQSVQLHDGFLGTQVIPATVSKIEGVAKEVNGVRKLTVHCTIAMSAIPKGVSMVMDGGLQGDIIIATKKQVLQVPKTSVIVESNANYVFVFKKNIVEKRAVTLGLEGKDAVEIVTGLKDKEQIVTSGQLNLKNAQRVSIADAKDAAAGGANELF